MLLGEIGSEALVQFGAALELGDLVLAQNFAEVAGSKRHLTHFSRCDGIGTMSGDSRRDYCCVSLRSDSGDAK